MRKIRPLFLLLPLLLAACTGSDNLHAPQVTLTPHAGGITVSWLAVDHATGYRIYWRDADHASALLTEVSDGLSYDHTGLEAGATYYYRVAAFNVVGEGPRSAEMGATVPAGVTFNDDAAP